MYSKRSCLRPMKPEFCQRGEVRVLQNKQVTNSYMYEWVLNIISLSPSGRRTVASVPSALFSVVVTEVVTPSISNPRWILYIAVWKIYLETVTSVPSAFYSVVVTSVTHFISNPRWISYPATWVII